MDTNTSNVGTASLKKKINNNNIKGLKYFIRTFGCQMNEHDSERIAGLLESDGMSPASQIDSADLVLFNTCCIRENADNKFYGNLGLLKEKKQKNPEMLIAVAGCLAQKDRDLIRKRADYVDVVFGTHNIHRATELIKYAKEHGPIVEILEEAVQTDFEDFPGLSADLPARREAGHRAWVTIQIGCDNSCAFCIVPSVRGPEISRPLDDIVREIEDLAQGGVREITLLGQNVNSYGRDIALQERRAGDSGVKIRPKFAELLRAVSRVEKISRIRFISPHPKDLLPETIQAMADIPEVCEHLHLPLQSGSNRVLAAMRRGYTREKFLQRLSVARSQISDLAVSTDIIVGFPGETEKDFEDTLEVAAEAVFDSAYSFIFSSREGTAAADMQEEFIKPEIVKDRFERLQNVLKRSALLKHKERIGRTEEVLVEGQSPKNPAKTMGRTRQNKLVHWDSASFLQKSGISEKDGIRQLPPGSLALLEIKDAAPYFLRGELKEVIEPSFQKSSAEGSSVRVELKSPLKT